MKVYHGSDVKIKTIDLSKCRVGTDFGHGFYVTKHLKQAEDIAARVASWHDTMPVVTEFEFNEYAFEDKDFKTLRFAEYTDEWLDFIVKNRASITSKPMHDYDIVEGPVANDDIAARIIEQLMLDYQIDETQAADIFYNSDTFAQLTDETTQLYKKDWQEIYEMLKTEQQH